MAIRMVEGRHLHKCFTHARDHGEDLKVAIAIGVHPAVSIAAAYQAAFGVDEMLIANSLLDGKFTLSKTSYSQLYVPSHAEIVLEGLVQPNQMKPEGPFGEWTGHYAGGVRDMPVIDIKAIYHRNDPILLGVPPMGAGPDEMARYRAVSGYPRACHLLSPTTLPPGYRSVLAWARPSRPDVSLLTLSR